MDSSDDPCQDVSDIILAYLEAQEPNGENYSTEKIFTSEDVVHDILQDLLEKIQKIEALKEEYEFNVKHHNQYPLFDLRKVIPSFEIDDNLYNSLAFRESLVVGTLGLDARKPIPCGVLCLDIQQITGEKPLKRITPDIYKDNVYKKLLNQMHMNFDQEIQTSSDLRHYSCAVYDNLEQEYTKFLIHLSARFEVQEQNAGITITSWVDKNFHTIEETRSEFIGEDDMISKKTLYFALQKDKYFVRSTCTDENLDESKYYSLGKAAKYVSEGANFVLMRYLAITRYIGHFELSCAYINGDMCRNLYECLGPESGVFNDTKLDICCIYRTITEECGLIHQSLTVLTLEGQILKQEWKNTSYMFYINPYSEVKNEKRFGALKILLEKSWQQDVHLFSKYLDAKTENKLIAQSYLKDHPEIENLLADYVQQALHIKPTDVIEFTMNYFSSYAPTCFEKFKHMRLSAFTDRD